MRLARLITRGAEVFAEALPPGGGREAGFRILEDGTMPAAARRALGPTPAGGAVPGGSVPETGEVELRAPCAPPTYVAEMECNSLARLPEHHLGRGYPMLTLLPGTVVNHPGGVVRPPSWSTRVTVNAQFAFVCSRAVTRPEEATADAVLGYTLMISVADWSLVDGLTEPTVRDLSMNEDYGRWFDGYKPIGPWLITADELPSVRQSDITVTVGDRRTVTRGADLLYEPLDILVRLASHLPFAAGDIVGLGATGADIEIRRSAAPSPVEMKATCDQIGDLVCTIEFPGGPSRPGRPEGVPRAAAPGGGGPTIEQARPGPNRI